MPGFTKLHSTIINSSVWDEPDSVRIVWITLLAMSDALGFVESSLGGLAHQARKSREDTTEALTRLESPDPDSKNPDHDGRRIKRVEGGWMILNYVLYRERAELSDDPEAAATRERVRKHRERKRQERYNALHPVTPASASVSDSALLEGIVKGRNGEHPTIEQAVAYGGTIGLPAVECEKMVDYYSSNGWRVGKNPMKSWEGALRNWKRNWQERGPAASTAARADHKLTQWEIAQRLEAIPGQIKAAEKSDNWDLYKKLVDEQRRLELLKTGVE